MKPSGKFHTFWFGLAGLGMLDTLNLAANKFEDVEKLKGLSERPSLRSVDVSSNYFEDGDALVNFWESNLPNVQCLYLHHNPCSRRCNPTSRIIKVGLALPDDVGSQWVLLLPHHFQYMCVIRHLYSILVTYGK